MSPCSAGPAPGVKHGGGRPGASPHQPGRGNARPFICMRRRRIITGELCGHDGYDCMIVPRPRCLLVTPLAQAAGWPGPMTTFPRPAAINVNYDGKSPNNPQILPPAKHILIVLGWAGLGWLGWARLGWAGLGSFYLLINKAGRQ